jgi:hypothetical protein
MSDLFRDIWHDLREKRLWPVALALALAIVAIPAVLTKSAAQPPSSDPVATAPAPDDRVAVKLDGGDAASSGAGSALDEFAEGDPFTPPGAIAKNGDAGAATASLAGANGDDGTDLSLDGGAPPPSSSPDTPTEPAPPVTRTETTEYQYVADVTLWTGNKRREVRGLRKLDMLPNQSAPVLIFMGTSGNGGNAVFLVDSTLKAAGEGTCVPSRANCAYVHIGPGSEHAFTTEAGDSYRLRVDEIRRVKLSASTAGATRPVAQTAVGDGADAAVRPFQLPSLVDLIAVTDTTTTTPAPQPKQQAQPRQQVTDSDSSVPADGR